MCEPTLATHDSAVWHELPHFSLLYPIPGEANYFEQLVTKEVGVNRYKLLCIPFFLQDVALGDVIEGDAMAALEELGFQVVERSGRSVFRVWFEQSSANLIEECLAELRDLGALVEKSSRSLYAVDAADDALAQKIAAYLLAGEQDGKWTYETGRISG